MTESYSVEEVVIDKLRITLRKISDGVYAFSSG